jgi:DNA gyrase subunit A
MRIVIELKQEEGAETVLNQLYMHTPMKTTFGVQLLAIHRNQPVTCNLQQVLGHFIDFRVEVVTRRTRYLLVKAEARAHILEGLKIALDNIDEVVELIKKSKDIPAARESLMGRFGLTELQTNAILEMRLSRLTGLEREKIEQELKDVLAEIDRLKGILSDEKKLYAVIVEELKEIKDRYGDDRRTEIIRR